MTPQIVILVFPSLNKLWDFVREAKINYTEFSSENCSLACYCNASDIELAKEKYKATT